MRMAGPTAWRCDACMRSVTGDDGVLTFRTQTRPPYATHAFRILHATCHRAEDDEHSTIGLTACLDRDGLSLLLAFLSADPGRPDEPGLTIGDLDEFVDVVRRLHVPFYEPARSRFDEPQVEQSLRRADRVSPYQSPALRRLVGTGGPLAGHP
jgi:hypothetical protein